MHVDSHNASIIGMSNHRKGMLWAVELVLPKWASRRLYWRKYMLQCPENVVWLTGERVALFFRCLRWEVEDKLSQIFCQRRASEPCPEIMSGLSYEGVLTFTRAPYLFFLLCLHIKWSFLQTYGIDLHIRCVRDFCFCSGLRGQMPKFFLGLLKHTFFICICF